MYANDVQEKSEKLNAGSPRIGSFKCSPKFLIKKILKFNMTVMIKDQPSDAVQR